MRHTRRPGGPFKAWLLLRLLPLSWNLHGGFMERGPLFQMTPETPLSPRLLRDVAMPPPARTCARPRSYGRPSATQHP